MKTRPATPPVVPVEAAPMLKFLPLPACSLLLDLRVIL
jgi:hypothetical protein